MHRFMISEKELVFAYDQAGTHATAYLSLEDATIVTYRRSKLALAN